MRQREWEFPASFGLVGKRRRYHGGGDSPAPQTSSTTTTQSYSPEETAARQKIWGAASKIYDQFTPSNPADAAAAAVNKANYTKTSEGTWKDGGAEGGSSIFTPGSSTFDQAGYDAAVATARANAPAGTPATPIVNPNAAPVPFSPDTIAAQNRLRDFSTGAGQQMANTAGGALQFGLHDVLDPTSSPGFQASLDSATRRIGETYTDPNGVLSKIRSGFTADNSGGSGTREGIANGLAARSYLNTVGDTTASMTSDAYAKGLDTFNKTLAFAPNAYNLMTQPALTQAGVGQQQEALAQAQSDYGASSASFNQNAPWLQLGNYANLIYGGSNPSTTTTGTAPGPTSNRAAPLGMAMQGAAMGTAIMPGMGTAIGAGAGLLMGML